MRVVLFIIIVSISLTFCKKRERAASYCENPYTSLNDTIYLDVHTNYFNHIDGMIYLLSTNLWNSNGNVNSFIWNTGEVTDSILVSTQGDYIVYALDVNNDTLDSLTFYIGTLTENIQVPNSFTPNGDGINDNFKPIVYAICPDSYSFRIYDKYNLLVFQSNYPLIGWDGTYKGIISPLGLYTYQIEATTIDGKYIQKEGAVTLLR